MGLEEIRFQINGKSVGCPPGATILDAAGRNGIRIPTLCHHPDLKPTGACRLCLVKDEGSGRILASCVTPVSPDLDIRTDSPEITNYRRDILRLMIANHPESCILCNRGNRCEMRKLAAELGIGETGLYPMPHRAGLEEANPFIIRDLSKCVLCGKCIRADHELVVVGAIDYNRRGFKSRPATAHERPLEKSSCTFCGTCVSLCPTGALATKQTRHAGSVQREGATICGFCGVGCSLVLGSVDETVLDARPPGRGNGVNRSTLCIRGHFAHDFLNVPGRLKRPLVRKEGTLVPVSWEEAVRVVARRLGSIRKESGPGSVALMGSSRCSLEENYLFQKMARAVLGTHNVMNGGYGAGEGVIKRVQGRLRGRGRVTPLRDLERAGLIFVLGADPAHSLPVLGYHIKRAAKHRGIPLIVADPRRTDLVPFSSLWLPLAPHMDRELINSLAAVLFQRKARHPDFIRRFTEDFEPYREGLASFDLDRACRITGIDPRMLEKAADLMEEEEIAFVVGHGILQQRGGGPAMDALINLALLTGGMDSGGSGLYLLSRENNLMGARDMGAVPDLLPGGDPLGDDPARKRWEKAWGVELSPDPGWNVVRMIQEAEKGRLRALYVMGENPPRGLPQPGRVLRALGNLDFLVVQDILETETTDMADVVLPGAAFSEKEGSFTNMEGRVQCFKPVVPPPGEARPDWEILDLLLSGLGYAGTYPSIREIREEIGELVPLYGAFREDREFFWIGASPPDPSDPREGKGRIRFSRVLPMSDEPVDEGYPLRALVGSLRCHLGSGTRTGYSSVIREFGPGGDAEISVQDAADLDLTAGDKVRITSPWGFIVRPVAVRPEMRTGLVFLPTGFYRNDVMGLMALASLEDGDGTGWKECPVRLERL